MTQKMSDELPSIEYMLQLEESEKYRQKIVEGLNTVFKTGDGFGGMSPALVHQLASTLSSDPLIEKYFWSLSEENMKSVAENAEGFEAQAGLIIALARCKSRSIHLYSSTDSLSAKIIRSGKILKFPRTHKHPNPPSFLISDLYINFFSDEFRTGAQDWSSETKSTIEGKIFEGIRNRKLYRVSMVILALLSETYGEKLMIEVFEKSKIETGEISFVDLVKILDDWENIKDYPLSWSVALMSTNRG